jgi:recombinational DNA repair protein RecT
MAFTGIREKERLRGKVREKAEIRSQISVFKLKEGKSIRRTMNREEIAVLIKKVESKVIAGRPIRRKLQ